MINANGDLAPGGQFRKSKIWGAFRKKKENFGVVKIFVDIFGGQHWTICSGFYVFSIFLGSMYSMGIFCVWRGAKISSILGCA